ncbi:hypothetical protein MAUB1S_06921 [Mycolicibacterium aubagnense]
MKKLLLASVVLLAPTSMAAAADTQQPSVERLEFNWTGAYGGGQVGGGWDHQKKPDVAGGVGYNTGGFLGGIYAGYNWQIPGNNIVLGIDTDFTLSGVGGDGTAEGNGSSLDWKWTGAVRGRVGYAFDRFLPYIAGGLAYGRYDVSYTYPNGAVVDGKDTVTGWTLGGGFDYAFTDNLIGRFEYRYSDFGINETTLNWRGAPWGDFFYTGRVQDIRLGVAYKF